MNEDQFDRFLYEGIASAKKGEKERAQELLLTIIEFDEENEKAWLWLSGVVDSDEDRRICLENVLTVNPDNSTAKRVLERLERTGVSASISFQSESNYDDVWERDSDICDYCAAEIGFEDKCCPNCRRKLFASYYRYPKPSSESHLGYYQRSLDVLESAYRMTLNAELKLELEQIIAHVKYESAMSSMLSQSD